MKRIWIGLLALHSCLPAAQAQKTFTEGTLLYTLTISSATGQEATISGKMQITVKGNKLSKEFSLASGAKSLFVVRGDENIAYSLINANNKQYAIEFNAAELKKKKQVCDKVKTTQVPDDKETVAELKAGKMNVSCGTNTAILYYARDWKISNTFIFEEFPGLDYLPLSFDITDHAGRVLHYELKKCSPEPIDESSFRVPANYKIISEKEYQQLTR
jgi:hypothetical protein